MTRIPKTLHEPINSAFPTDVCLVATVLPSGFAQVSPRGSTQVFDDQHFSLWERGRGSTTDNLADGTKVTIYFRKPQLRVDGVLPKGGIARFYGVARLHKSGAVYRGSLATADPAGEGPRPREERLRRPDRGRARRGARRNAAGARLSTRPGQPLARRLLLT